MRIEPCAYCQQVISRYGNPKSKLLFCSRKCKGQYWSLHFSGENNSNYGKKWSDEKKSKQSQIISAAMDTTEVKFMCGSANRGKKFSKQIREKMSEMRTGKPRGIHSADSKLKIGKKSREKFTDCYKIKYRKRMEEIGAWIPLDQKTDVEIYWKIANWVEKMWNRVDDPHKLKLLGVYNSFSNKNGVVRDHNLSRKTGFQNKIFPEILRHPCNCQILTHKENVQKRFSGVELTLSDLFDKILNYKEEWREQDLVVSLIKKYENGERWKNPYKGEMSE